MFELRILASNNNFLVDGLNQTAVTSPLHPTDNQIMRWQVQKNTNVQPYVHTFYLRTYTERKLGSKVQHLRRKWSTFKPLQSLIKHQFFFGKDMGVTTRTGNSYLLKNQDCLVAISDFT